MPILNRAAELQDEVAEWRRNLHAKPELLFDVHETADFVAKKLEAFGCDEVVRGLGRTGVVGIIRGDRQGAGERTIGLRADMDALPIKEESGVAWTSTVSGKMHACGHDGHTAMLLGAAKYLAETRNFSGSVAVIFQPAEEGGGGGNEMVRDGMMERFGIAEVYGMHNLPGLPVGQFAGRKGPIMGATDEFRVTVKGRGGHAAMPHETIDPIVMAAQMVQALQTISSRNANPVDAIVVSVTKINAGFAHNVIPEEAVFAGTVRSLSEANRDLGENRIRQICEGIASSHGATVSIWYDRNYPVTVNHDGETDNALSAATDVAGADKVDRAINPMLGGEDFSYMLNSRPGSFIFIGNGDSAGLHHPRYDFNDDVIPHGISYWVRLAEQRLGQ
ncbi:M20 aminoacylase family protein [Pararhizobium haloflavum]|uniref:M20 aminoacylase family protein n=1 Tax=Pararhizobium haloflavum TaxID=2037914 RepID=UPI000C189B80|nr:M20 aminoacylase family protein [Pararhizobium haloflavum]